MMYYLFTISLIFTLLCSLYIFKHFHNIMNLQSELINKLITKLLPVKNDDDINQTSLTTFYREEE